MYSAHDVLGSGKKVDAWVVFFSFFSNKKKVKWVDPKTNKLILTLIETDFESSIFFLSLKTKVKWVDAKSNKLILTLIETSAETLSEGLEIERFDASVGRLS